MYPDRLAYSKFRACWEAIASVFDGDDGKDSEDETDDSPTEIEIETEWHTETETVEQTESFTRKLDMIQLASGVSLVVYDRVYDDGPERKYCRFTDVTPNLHPSLQFGDVVTTVYPNNTASITTIGSYTIDVDFEVEKEYEYIVVTNYEELPDEIKDGNRLVKLDEMKRRGYTLQGDHDAINLAYNARGTGWTNQRPYSRRKNGRPAHLYGDMVVDSSTPSLTHNGSVADVVRENMGTGGGITFIDIDGWVRLPNDTVALPEQRD